MAKSPNDTTKTTPLLQPRTLTLLIAAVLVGAAAGVLTWISTGGIAAGLLAGCAATAVTLERLDKWVGS